MGMAVADPDVDFWLGHRVKTVPVLYLDFELGADVQHRRINKILRTTRWAEPENLWYISTAGFSLHQVLEKAYKMCSQQAIGLVIIDSVEFAIEGDSEKSSDAKVFAKTLKAFEALGVSIHLIDHQSKMVKGEKYSDKKPFGSVVKFNNSRSIWQLRAHRDNDLTRVDFTHTKSNLGAFLAPFSVDISFSGNEDNYTDEVLITRASDGPIQASAATDKLLAAFVELGQGTTEQARKLTDLEVKTAQNAASTLKEKGWLEVIGKEGRSQILKPTDEGMLACSDIPDFIPEGLTRELGNVGMTDKSPAKSAHKGEEESMDAFLSSITIDLSEIDPHCRFCGDLYPDENWQWRLCNECLKEEEDKGNQIAAIDLDGNEW